MRGATLAVAEPVEANPSRGPSAPLDALCERDCFFPDHANGLERAPAITTRMGYDQFEVPTPGNGATYASMRGIGPGNGTKASSCRPGRPAITNTLSALVGPARTPRRRPRRSPLVTPARRAPTAPGDAGVNNGRGVLMVTGYRDGPVGGSSTGRTPAFGAGCCRFEPCPPSEEAQDAQQLLTLESSDTQRHAHPARALESEPREERGMTHRSSHLTRLAGSVDCRPGVPFRFRATPVEHQPSVWRDVAAHRVRSAVVAVGRSPPGCEALCHEPATLGLGGVRPAERVRSDVSEGPAQAPPSSSRVSSWTSSSTRRATNVRTVCCIGPIQVERQAWIVGSWNRTLVPYS